jgi:hypothetical protein
MITGPAVDRWSVVTGLRRWARGLPADEAAVELQVGMGARFTCPGSPWVKPCARPGWFWLDPDELAGYRGRLTPGQRRLLALVVTLLGGKVARTAPAARAVEGRAAA